MLLLNISFISGALRSSHIRENNIETTDVGIQGQNETTHDGICTAVAVLTHYFVMTTLAWMGVEAATMYQLLIQVFTTVETHFLLKRFLIAWGRTPDLSQNC